MSEIINRECLIKCPECEAIVTAAWRDGGFLKKGKWYFVGTKDTCPRCHKKVELKNIETRTCPYCGKLVQKTAEGKCLNPECGMGLASKKIIGRIKCDKCGLLVEVPEGYEGDLYCECGNLIPRDTLKQLERKTVKVTQPQYIQLPDLSEMMALTEAKSYVTDAKTSAAGDSTIVNDVRGVAVWEHPLQEFPFKSRMQVNEGTYALFFQNGACGEPCGPGQYLLENMNLTTEKKLDAAMTDDSVVFRTRIFCVRRDISEFPIGAVTESFRAEGGSQEAGPVTTDIFANADRSADYTASCRGSITLQVCDAKEFCRYLGFKPFMMEKLAGVSKAVDGTSDGILVEMLRQQLKDVLFSIVRGMDDRALQKLVPADIQPRVVADLNRVLAGNGLCVKQLWLKELNIKKTEASQAGGSLLEAMRREFQWSVPDVRLCLTGQPDLYADCAFKGYCRLDVADVDRFFDSSEGKQLLKEKMDSYSDDDNKCPEGFVERVRSALKDALTVTAQKKIDDALIRDILNPNDYVDSLTDALRSRLNDSLRGFGLKVDSFSVSLPEIVASDALRGMRDLPKRREAVRRAVEKVIGLKSERINIHSKGKASINMDVVFGGKVGLRIKDDSVYFGLSEVKGFMAAGRAVSEQEIQSYYVNRLAPAFKEVLSRVTQSVVDQTNADLRAINAFTAILSDSVKSSMNLRIEKWGLELETLDLDEILRVNTSPNFDKMIEAETVKAGTELDEEIQTIKNNHTVYLLDEEGRLTIHGMEVKDRVEEKTAELELAKQERTYLLERKELEKRAELNKLVDEIAEGKKARDAQAVFEEYKRDFALHQRKLDDQLEEGRKLQQSRIDRENADLKQAFDKRMADAENQRAISEVLRRIAESDLSWQQKLDEYDRLRRRAFAETDVEIRKLNADADTHIIRDRNELYYEIDGKRIKLSAEQAELMERIDRYAEERRRRVLDGDADRMARMATLDFEHAMQERREKAAQELDRLAREYEHDEKLSAQAAELEKLCAELDYYAHAVSEQEDTARVRAEQEGKAKVAQAEAEKARLEKQLKADEDALKSAQELRKTVLETMEALELARIKGSDKEEKARTDQNSKDIQAIERKVERISGAVAQTRAMINNLTQWLQTYRWYQPQPQVVVPPQVVPQPQPQVAPQPQPQVVPQQPQVIYVTQHQPGAAPAAPAPAAPAAPAAPTGTTMECPICKRTISAGSTTCPFCKLPIIRQ